MNLISFCKIIYHEGLAQLPTIFFYIGTRRKTCGKTLPPDRKYVMYVHRKFYDLKGVRPKF